MIQRVSEISEQTPWLYRFETGNLLGSFREWYFQILDICAILGYYSAYSGNSLPTFRDNLSVPSPLISWSLKTGPDNLYVPGSVNHSIIHIKNPNKCNSVSKFYFIFIWSSTCFGRHTTHHREPKTALSTSGFAYVEGCWTLTASSNYTSNNPPRMQNQRLLVQF